MTEKLKLSCQALKPENGFFFTVYIIYENKINKICIRYIS